MKTLVCQEVLADLKDLETALTGVDERKLQEANSILIYLNGPQWTAVSSGGLLVEESIGVARQQALDRLEEKQLFFAPDPNWLCSRNVHPLKSRSYQPLRFDYLPKPYGTFEQLEHSALAILIESAMCAAIEEGFPRCIVHAPAGQHFDLPSKAHASHFIRLSEAFDCVESVQRVAYWIVVSLLVGSNVEDELPERVFLVDHPSMLLLGTHINQIYGGEHKVLTLKGYPSEATLRTQASKLLTKHVPVTAIIGIASTGRLAQILQELAMAKGVELEIRIAFSPVDDFNGSTPLARLSVPDYSHSVEATTCKDCEDGGPPPIQIHGHSFLISVAHPAEVKLKPTFFTQQRPFLDKYGAVPGVLRVHFDDPNEVHPRHHAFGIDVTVLLSNADFLTEVIQKLESFDPRPDFVVLPDHKANELLRQVIQQWCDMPVVTLDGLHELENLVPRSPSVLVFDDKIVSGSRMRKLNAALRAPRPTIWDGFSHVHFFAPVATTGSKKQFDELKKGLTTNHPWSAELHHIYCIHLPEWHTRDQCPWCIEEKLIGGLAEESGTLDSPIVDRLGILKAKESLYQMGCLSPTPGHENFPALAAGAVALNAGASQLQVLLSAASAVQQLRTDMVMPLNPYSLTQPTWMGRFVVEDAYSEKLIACSILRSLEAAEVSSKMRDYLAQSLRFPNMHDGMHFYQVELAMALIMGKMGTVNDIGAAWYALAAYGVSERSLLELGFVKPTKEH